MKSLRFLGLIAVILILTPAAFAADFGVRAGRLNEANENFVGAEVVFNLGSVSVNPNVEYWLVDNVTEGTANVDVTVGFGSASVKPYVGAGVGLFYSDSDLGGSNTDTLGNLIGGVQFNLDFLKPYGQVKYSRSLESGSGNGHELALTVGLRF